MLSANSIPFFSNYPNEFFSKKNTTLSESGEAIVNILPEEDNTSSKTTCSTEEDIAELIPISEDDSSIDSFNCPVTHCRFEDPVVDECGHTFERAMLMKIYQDAAAKGKAFKCPMNPSKILDINKIVKNYTLAGAQEEVDDLIKKRNAVQTTAIETIKKYALQLEEHKKQDQLDRQQAHLEQKKEHDRFISLLDKHEKIMNDFKPLAEETKKVIDKSDEILENYSVLRDKCTVQEKRIKNFKRMRFMDMINLIFYPSYAKKIANRNITDDEQLTLQEPVITEDDLASQRQDLDILKEKIRRYEQVKKEHSYDS